MTHPPRPKYPSDAKNYHDMRWPGFAHTIRLPEELLQPYVNLKVTLGPRTTHADEEPLMVDPDEADPDDNIGDVAQDSEDSDPEILD
ncbi:hypothetical protein R1sor_018112 [Riccia sorocarpa]|uniref:Uncharacterized protein n=1 Tax=Riccia sorocarpa TaxID=122646 RepID=A0ABD3ICC0_9MARC